MSLHPRAYLAVLLALFLSLCSAVIAQTITGSVNGTIQDQSGKTITGAKVTATSVETGITNATVSNDDGAYSIRFLPIGSYKVTVEAAGFAQQLFGPFMLEVGQDARINATLQVSGAQTQVRVDALIPLLDTENATNGTTLDSVAIENVPLNGRNFSTLTMFVPGAVESSPAAMMGSAAIERSTSQGNQISINANRQQTNNYLLDGIEINETINNYVGYNPSPDALAEVRIISANAQAEYGNVTGGDVIAVMKSGTESFHGSAFSYIENYLMDANSWGNKDSKTITPKAPYTQNVYGGTIGGPIIKGKLFFFGDYEGAGFHKGGTSTLTVATPRMRTGDFSELLDPQIMCSSTGGVCSSSQKLIQLYDPANNFAPYAGNLNVPITNPVATYLFAHPELYPLPNNSPSPNSPVTNNFRGSSNSIIHNQQGDIKVDWKARVADQGFVRYTQGEAGDSSVSPIAITFPTASTYPVKGIAANWVHTFSPALVNEFRAGYTRIRFNQGNPNDTTGIFGYKGNSIVGIPGAQAFQGFSYQEITDFTYVGAEAVGTNFIDNTFEYGDNLMWQRGKHLYKAGAQFVRYQQNNYFPGNDGALGLFQYTGVFSSNPGANATTNPNGYNTSGYSLTDFLRDRVYFLGVGGVTGRSGQRQWRSAYFAQDDWKARPNLTVNLGLRYEFDQPIYEVNNKEVNVNLTTGALMYAGKDGNSRALYNPYYANVMPRLGFSYAVNNRLVVRGGYGITTFMEGTGAALRLTYNPPYQPSFEATGIAPSATSEGTWFAASAGFTSANNTNYSGTTYRAWQQDLKPEFTSQYSLTTEYQLNNFSSLSIGYTGETGQHLILAEKANQLAAPCYIGGVLQTSPNSTACAAADPAPFQALVGQAGNVAETASNGMMNYNGLQVTYRQRVQNGLQFTINYAYGHGLTNTRGFFGVPSVGGAQAYAENAYNNHAEYGPVGQDIRHNINGTAVYELPVGRGKQFAGHINSVLDEAIGGWKVAMTGVVYTGFPVTINNSTNNAYTNNNGSRADHLHPLVVKHRSINNWFGTDPSATSCLSMGVDNGVCAYGNPAAGTYGSAAVGSERAPGFQQYDLSLFKDFVVHREQSFGFRVDATNAFNVSSYASPDNTAEDATFGQITGVRSVPRQLQISAKYRF